MGVNADLIVEHASELITCAGPDTGITGAALGRLETIADGAVAITGGRIVAVGPSSEIAAGYDAGERIDATGRLVTPGLVDAHSHLVYRGSRHDEWEHKAVGSTSPASLAGGIHRSVEWTRAADEAALTIQALRDLDTILAHGTTTIEAKTGYGLARAAELRLLRVTRALTHAVEIVPTFLGMHVPPREYADRPEGYVDLVIEMLDEVAGEAEFCDVCCDPIGFTREQCFRAGARARDLGLGIRVHADQTGDADGGRLAASLGAASADHLDYTPDAGLRAMAAAGTAAIFFPGVAHHMLEMSPRVDGDGVAPPEKLFLPLRVRRAIAAGCVVALSADYNPGSCPCPSLQAVMQLAARLFRLGYAEIWNMCTLNAAASLGRGREIGSLEPGKRADVVIWTEPYHGMIVNRFGYNMVDKVLAAGHLAVSGGRVTGSSGPGSTRIGTGGLPVGG